MGFLMAEVAGAVRAFASFCCIVVGIQDWFLASGFCQRCGFGRRFLRLLLLRSTAIVPSPGDDLEGMAWYHLCEMQYIKDTCRSAGR